MNSDKLLIDMETRLSVNPNLVLRIEDDDCALLFDPDNGRVQMLNATAVGVWQLLDGNRSLQDVVDCLKERYEGFDDTGERQVLALTERLANLGAVGIWEKF
jgi:hypothetical protein